MNILVLKNATVLDRDGQTLQADLIVVRGDALKEIKLFQNDRDRIALIIQGGGIHKHLV